MDEDQYQELLTALRIAHVADEIEEPLRTYVRKAREYGLDHDVIADDLERMAIYVRAGLEVGLWKHLQLLQAEDDGVPREMVRRALAEIGGGKAAMYPASALRTALSRARAAWTNATSEDSNVPPETRDQVNAALEALRARTSEAKPAVAHGIVEGLPKADASS